MVEPTIRCLSRADSSTGSLSFAGFPTGSVSVAGSSVTTAEAEPSLSELGSAGELSSDDDVEPVSASASPDADEPTGTVCPEKSSGGCSWSDRFG